MKDDNEDINHVIKYVLDMEGYVLSEVDNGLVAEDEIVHFKPNLILRDVWLETVINAAIQVDRARMLPKLRLACQYQHLSPKKRSLGSYTFTFLECYEYLDKILPALNHIFPLVSKLTSIGKYLVERTKENEFDLALYL